MSDPGRPGSEGRFDPASTLYLEVDGDWRVTDTEAADDGAIDLEAPVGDPLWTVLPVIADTPLEDALRTAMRTREPAVTAGPRPEEPRFELRAAPTTDGLTLFLTDVTPPAGYDRRLAATLRTLRSLYDVTTDPDLGFEDKVDRTLALGCEHLGLPYGFLSRIDPEDGPQGRQTIVQARGDHPLLQPDESCPLSEAYCRRTIDTDGLLAIQDAVADGMADDPAYEVFELGSYIGGKVVIDGDLYGTFCFAATDARADPFTQADRMLVRVMSKWMSYELDRQRTHAELRRTNERLEQFASAVSHDLRNPLTVAKGRLELAAETHADDHDDLAASLDALDRMETMIQESLVLARDGAAATDLESVDLAAVAADAFETVDTADATLDAGATAAIRADPDRLQRLLENLLRNAVEHGGTDVTITVGDRPDGFFVADDGDGIPAEDREAVFDHGFTTTDSGTGFGLAIVREIATAHDWTVSVTDSDAGGARVDVTGVERA